MNSSYSLRKQMGMCVRCGGRPAAKGMVRCERCNELNKKVKPEEPRRVVDHNPNKKLDSDALEAFNEGLSYGKWRMKKYLEGLK